MKYILLTLRFGLMAIQRIFYFLTAGEWPPFASVAVVIEDGGKFLMIKRRDGRGYGLPGGYIKLHESAEEAAIREVKEETGYEVELLGVRQILSGKRKSTKVRAVDIIYDGRIAGGQIGSSLEGQAQWVKLEDIKDKVAFDYLKALESSDLLQQK